MIPVSKMRQEHLVASRNGAKAAARASAASIRRVTMSLFRAIWGALVVLCTATTMASAPASAQGTKPNILFIMGDDIGIMQPSIYHRGLMVGETPNIDRIGNDGAIFMDYYAEQSCTAGRNAFFTGMHPLRTGMIPPQLPGTPSWLRPGTRRLPSSCLIRATAPE